MFKSAVKPFLSKANMTYMQRLFKKFISVFEQLPVAALIDDKILCMHGGLSAELHDYNDIEMIQRPTDVPDSGLLCDLLWADPADN